MSATAERATLAHGFTMADVHRLANAAVSRARSKASDNVDRYEAAWFGIVEALYASDIITERELLFAGMDAVDRLAREHIQAHGLNHATQEWRPGFVKYWDEHVTPSHEGAAVERVALPQVLALLTPAQYDALVAVAVTPSLSAAAEALGIGYHSLLTHYYAARRICREAWHAPDAAPSERATEDACGSGHPKAKFQRTGPTGHQYCAECQRLAKKRRRAAGRAA